VIAACSDAAAPLRQPPITRGPRVRVAVKPDGIVLVVGDTVRMRAATDPPIPVSWEWAVLPPHLATVDSRGLVQALDRGQLEIRACAEVPERVCGFAPLTIR